MAQQQSPAGDPPVISYIRFEIYIPNLYKDRTTKEIRAVDPLLIEEFSNETLIEFQGFTQANPIAPAPFRGSWQSERGALPEHDFVTYLFTFVLEFKYDEALAYFRRWKRKLEEGLQQDVIAVLFYGVNSIGFLSTPT